MPDRVFSIFGTYDFLGKSLPGTTFVLVMIPLLPDGSLLLPSLDENFLVFVVLFLSLILVGTLLGELIHAIAQYFEVFILWFARRVRNTGQLLCGHADETPPSKQFSGSPYGQLKESDSVSDKGEEIDADSSFSQKVSYSVQNWKGGISNWIDNLHTSIVYVLWSHRKIFEHRLTSRIEFPIEDEDHASWGPFTQQFLIEYAVDELGIKESSEANNVYSVVTSSLSEQGGRAERFQAQYSFCRSMGAIAFLAFFSYMFSIYSPRFLVPKALGYRPYLHRMETYEIHFISYLMIPLGLIFLFAAGSYKKNYIEYLMSEFYIYSDYDEE